MEYDNPMNEIMGEAEANISTSAPARWLNFVGKTGRYMLGGLSKEEQDSHPLAERKKVKALILYIPADMGRALWPDGTVFQGKEPLCQSERSISPYDVARQGKIPVLDRAALKQMGHTGTCSTCQVPTNLCKPRLVAYIVDLDHVKEISDWNAANPEGPKDVSFTKVDGKGPQNFYNASACYRTLYKQAVKDKATLSDYVVEFSHEEGAQGSKKLSFKISAVLPADSPLRSIANMLASEALAASKAVRKSFIALPQASQRPALGPETVEDFVIDDVDEIPF